MTDIPPLTPPDKPRPIAESIAACGDRVILRTLLGLIDTAERQRALIALLESRVGLLESAVHELEAERDRSHG